MADREMIAATLATSVAPRADFYNQRDLRNPTDRIASFVVDMYESILAELVKRETSGRKPGP